MKISRCTSAWAFVLSLVSVRFETPAQAIFLNKPSPPLAMVAFRDPWPPARERWWDIASVRRRNRDRYNQFNAWLNGGVPNGQFDYATRAANVKLIYDQAPRLPCFVAHLSVRSLKPNFAYQLKLAGKPVAGPRGMGTATSYVSTSSKSRDGAPLVTTVLDANGQSTPINGDDWTNQQLGYIGRWWNDSNPSGNTNAVSDFGFRNNFFDTIYGYQFLGVFVTDRQGNAEWDIYGNRSYHITWQEWQKGAKNRYLGGLNILGAVDLSRPNQFYGYGAQPPSSNQARFQQNGQPRMQLFYELQRGRPNPVVLPRGAYHCRLLITEETFHNDVKKSALGGHWQTVLASEDFIDGAPDIDAANDIVFTIS